MLEEHLQNSGIDRIDAEILLGCILKKHRTWILAHPEAKISEGDLQKFAALVTRRKTHEPIAYIVGEKEFYGRKFFVDNRVLIPRPATEVLIDEVKKMWSFFVSAQNDTGVETRITPADSEIVIFSYLKKKTSLSIVNCQLLDVGTGSGCIGITLALEIPEAKILCTDISEDALEVAKENAARHGVSDRITFQKANVIPKELVTKNQKTRKPENLINFLIVSNPPYIPCTSRASGHSGTGRRPHKFLPPDVLNFEPHEALFAGAEGMDMLTPLFEECLHQENCLGCILECREEQAKKLSSHS